jgi:hypothetical protein
MLQRLGRFALRFIGVAIVGVAFSSALASNVQFVGSVGYSTDGTTIAILTVNNIHNNDATGSSANLRVELWASSQPFSGSFTSGYRLSTYGVGPLAAGSSTGKITAGPIPFSPPPGGTWYVAMVLTEYAGGPTNDGYALRDFLNFANTMWVPGSPPPPSDTTPPTVSIASPTGGNVAGTVSVSVSASDNVGVTRVDLLVNGASVGSDTSAPYQFSWNSASVANGPVQLRAVAHDAAGNSAQSAIVTVNVANVVTPPPDTMPPTVSIASPTGGNVSGTVSVSANATDNVGVTRVDFFVNGSLVGSDSTAPYQYSWNTATVANGAATLRAAAYDAAGNSAQSAIVTVNVANVVTPPPDTTPPNVSIASPAGGNVSGTVTISANASDNVGVTRVDFFVNGSLVGSDSTAPYQYSWNTAAVGNGAATLRAIAYDAAGNSAQSAIVTVNVANVVAPPPPPPPPADTTPPTVSIASPIGGTVSGTVTVSVSATDNVGVTRVDLLVNEQVVGTDSSTPWKFSWNSAGVADGAVRLKAVAYDAAGNSGTSPVVVVTVANAAAPPPILTTVEAIEFYNASLDHYFISASQLEIEALDTGHFAGWARTGQTINVYTEDAQIASPVCRFYIPPAYGDSHFYSASPAECSQVAAKFPFFVYESSDVFRVDMPDIITGACPNSETPVYRVWNNRADTNHRYTTSRAIRDQMVALGYVAEGYGPDAVIMCAPL